MNIVVDEWIIHFMSYKAPSENQKIVFELLDKVFKKCDKFVTIRGAGLDRKIWQMAKKSTNWAPKSRYFVKWFMANFRHNSKKFYILEDQDIIPLSQELMQMIPKDDLYLIKSAISTKGIIITTDNKLKEKLTHQEGININLVADFILRYDC